VVAAVVTTGPTVAVQVEATRTTRSSAMTTGAGRRVVTKATKATTASTTVAAEDSRNVEEETLLEVEQEAHPVGAVAMPTSTEGHPEGASEAEEGTTRDLAVQTSTSSRQHSRSQTRHAQKHPTDSPVFIITDVYNKCYSTCR